MPYQAPSISSAGVVIPSFTDILNLLITDAQTIFGTDIYLANDSQDYQWISAIAAALYDAMQLCVLASNNQSPSTAIGAALDSLVKLNGLVRLPATYSTCIVTLTGTPGTVIPAGVVQDVNGMLWNITPNVTIPSGGVLTATATCQTIGPVLANAGDINIIYNIMSGWNSVLNPASAVPGMAQETDLTLRKEQSTSVMLSSTTPVAGTLAALSQLSGVKRVFIDENTGALADADGVPPHSIGVIIDGGDSIEIAEAIAQHKTIGCGTSGSINIPLPAAYGIEGNINFSRAIYDTIGVEITLTMFAGYTQAIQDQIIANVTNFLNTLPIGVTVTASALYLPTLLAQLSGIPSFNVSSLVINENGGEFGASAVVGWNEAAVAGTIVIAGGL